MNSMKTNNPSVAIIGSGFGGLGMGVYLKKAGMDSFRIFEKASNLGGVWRENTYPGAACDIPSHLYSYSFEPHYPWSCRYGHQPEILAYQHHVADKYGLKAHIDFGHEVVSAEFDEARQLWVIRFANGKIHEAQVLISSVGQLHRPMIPKIKGQETFAGKAFHSAQWDHQHALEGRSVAVIGTGASAVQFVPIIAKQVKKLFVFQRSTGWCIPKFDRRFSRIERFLLDKVPVLHDLDRLRVFSMIEFLASATVRKGVLSKIAQGVFTVAAKTLLRLQVKDPEMRRKLTPDHAIGCKRTLLSNEWIKTLVSPPVSLVTDGIREITPEGVVTEDGQLHRVDTLIYGTGFAATEFLAPMDLRGVGGKSLRAEWKEGAEAYLGITVAGFPNFFMMYGPNTNLGAGSIIYMLERQNRYIVQCLEQMRSKGRQRIEVKPEAQREYNLVLAQRNRNTPYESGCHSWYINAQGRNTNNWVGYMSEYDRETRKPVLEHYHLA